MSDLSSVIRNPQGKVEIEISWPSTISVKIWDGKHYHDLRSIQYDASDFGVLGLPRLAMLIILDKIEEEIGRIDDDMDNIRREYDG